MVDYQNVICNRLVRLGIFVIMVYRPPSNSSEYNEYLSQFILNFSFDREVILIGDFNLPSIIGVIFHPFQSHFKPTTQTFVDP